MECSRELLGDMEAAIESGDPTRIHEVAERHGISPRRALHLYSNFVDFVPKQQPATHDASANPYPDFQVVPDILFDRLSPVKVHGDFERQFRILREATPYPESRLVYKRYREGFEPELEGEADPYSDGSYVSSAVSTNQDRFAFAASLGREVLNSVHEDGGDLKVAWEAVCNSLGCLGMVAVPTMPLLRNWRGQIRNEPLLKYADGTWGIEYISHRSREEPLSDLEPTDEVRLLADQAP